MTGQKRERQASRPDQASASPEAEPPEGPEAIDWSLEAEAAGTRAAARDRRERRQRERFAPPRNDTFTPPASKAEFPWHHARTHRVEPLEGGGSLINLNDNFVLVVLGMIPFPTCKLGRIPARGDLFDHMRDIPESRSWKDR